MRMARIFMCAALAGLTGCSAFNSPFNNAQNTSSYNTQTTQTDDYQTTDDTPHAISQYLDELRIAGNGQVEEQSTHEKYKRQN